MRTCIQLWMLLVVTAFTESIFFPYPKNALTNFFQTLRGKQDDKPSNIHHYHLHYYPAPLVAYTEKVPIAPERRELDELHSEKLKSLGWENEEYSIPDPTIIIPSKLDNLWADESKPPSFSWDSSLFESISGQKKEKKEPADVLVQVPLHQQIIFHVPPEEKTESPGILGSIFRKIFSASSGNNKNQGWKG